jgi:hypothetical protein
MKASLAPSLGGCQKMDLNFPQNLQNLLKLKHRESGYELFFTKFCLRLLFAFAYYVGDLHPTNMD